MNDDSIKTNKTINSKIIEQENEAWARFLYKQYRKKKIKESLLKIKERV
ncbi:MAG: hypothetical protein WC451_01545 [Patescibacteria group bacterium]